MENEIRVYTDGSASFKNGLGGSGVYIINGEKEYFLQKGFSNTKVGRCEIHALILALQFFENKNQKIIIYSDSQYVVNSIEKGWVYDWERDYWFGRLNADLWQRVLVEYRKFPKGNIKLKHIKGHQLDMTNPHILGNNIADCLADYHQFIEREEDKKL